MFSSLRDTEIDETLREYEGKQFSDFKKDLSDLLISSVSPIRKELIKLENDKGYVRDILDDGRSKAIEKSEVTIKKVRNIVGLG